MTAIIVNEKDPHIKEAILTCLRNSDRLMYSEAKDIVVELASAGQLVTPLPEPTYMASDSDGIRPPHAIGMGPARKGFTGEGFADIALLHDTTLGEIPIDQWGAHIPDITSATLVDVHGMSHPIKQTSLFRLDKDSYSVGYTVGAGTEIDLDDKLVAKIPEGGVEAFSKTWHSDTDQPIKLVDDGFRRTAEDS